MGCLPSSRKTSETLKRKLPSRSVSITPATFIRHSQSNNYSDYIELKKLGSGAFANVMLCMHKPTKTNRAVKLIRKSDLETSQKDQVFLLNEFKILRGLDHPNILKCYEIFENPTFYFISTEYCPAGDLFTEITKLKKFTERQAAIIIYQLLSVLIYCHDNRVIHRDLKPENILLMEKGNELSIKVADFGNSVIYDPSSKIRGCFGTAYYVAPEILKSSYDEKCDLWSTGIITYILLTGKPPYSGKNTDSVLEVIKRTPFQINSENSEGISTEAADFLKKLLQINVNLRSSAKEAISHPWITKNYEGRVADIEVALNNLKHFNCNSKLKAAVNVFVASQISNHKDIKYFKKCFQEIDKNGDGKITQEELIQEYSKKTTVEEAQRISDEIIKKLDQDGNGQIDFTEFLVSCIEKQKQISLENLEIAFNLFDIDKNGYITADEIRMMLDDGETENPELWNEILKEADTNGDGCIDLKEFLHLMSSNVISCITGNLVKTVSSLNIRH